MFSNYRTRIYKTELRTPAALFCSRSSTLDGCGASRLHGCKRGNDRRGKCACRTHTPRCAPTSPS